MKVKESIASKCRYGEYVSAILGSWDVVEDKSENYYAGEIRLTAKKNNRYAYIQFYYGSCPYCDEWDERNLSEEEIKKEVRALILYFDLVKEYKAWKRRQKIK